MGSLLYDELSLLHFNDVYHITQSIALRRLAHIFRKAKDTPEADRTITLFSGDAFSPSLESAVMKGEHMVPILNHLLVDVACYGNHDFDFGEDVLVKLSRTCTFPWLLANAIHADGRLLATAKEYIVLEKKGYRIGFFGLAGTDWPSNCQHLPADCTIFDPVSVAKRVSNTLRSTHGVDIVIALTHMRWEEDIHLSQQCDRDIDLILGGHDHDLAVHGANVNAMNDGTFEGHIQVVKSGTDFKSFSAIQLHLARVQGKVTVGHVRVQQMRDITLKKDLLEDSGIHAILTGLQTGIAGMVDKPLFHSGVPLDGRTSIVRTRETNMGNMFADVVRAYYNADIAFINSGSLRCDRVIGAGTVTIKDMIDIFPFDNPFVVKRLHGDTISKALENAACDIIDGRFFQVSGIAFHIDRHQPVGARIHGVCLVPEHNAIRDPAPAPEVLLRAKQEYMVAMVAFIADGFDGYTLFKDIPCLVDTESAMTDSSLFLQVFRRETLCTDEEKSTIPIERARAAAILGTSLGGLPLVSPSLQGRIKYVP